MITPSNPSSHLCGGELTAKTNQKAQHLCLLNLINRLLEMFQIFVSATGSRYASVYIQYDELNEQKPVCKYDGHCTTLHKSHKRDH